MIMLIMITVQDEMRMLLIMNVMTSMTLRITMIMLDEQNDEHDNYIENDNGSG